jgi:hypothetical protein
MRARPGMSVHREDAQRDAEARADGIITGIELAIAFCIAQGHEAAAAELRAARIVEEDHPAKAVAAAE